MAKRLVIIGGGNAGLCLANNLSGVNNLDITLVEKKDHFDVVMQQPRSMVNEAFAQESLWNLRDALTPSAKLVQVKSIISVEGGAVKLLLHDGSTQDLPADAIVVATGSSYKSQWLKNNDGLDKSAWLAKMAEWRSALFRSKHVMIIGGGLTGVEVACEIATDFPSIKVTVVHSGNRLMHGSEKFHTRTLDAVKKLPGNVEFVLNDKVSANETLGENGPHTYTTTNGKQIVDVNMVLQCVGVTPNTSFVDSSKLDARGYIAVDEKLLAPQLSTPRTPVFAIGDCCDKGQCRLMVAREQAVKLAKSLKGWASTGKMSVLQKKDSTVPVFASLGRTQGIANFPFINNLLPRKMKAPDMFLGKSAGDLKVKGIPKLSAAAMAPQPMQL